MSDTTRQDAPRRPAGRRARLPRALSLTLAALALLGAPAFAAADGGAAAVPAKAAKAHAEAHAEAKAEADAERRTREVVVVAEPGDEPGGGVWMTKVLGGGYLGVELLPMTRDLRAHFGAPADQGVLVSRVEKGSPAAKAGLQAGDVIAQLDDQPVETPWDLTLAVRGHDTGDTARISAWRDGRPLDFEVALEERERQEIDLGRLMEQSGAPGQEERQVVRLRKLARPGEGPPVVFLHPEAMDRLGESLDKVDWPRLNERLGARNQELEKRIDELEKRLDELEKELASSSGKPR